MCHTILYVVFYDTFLKLRTWLESVGKCTQTRATLSYSRLLHYTGYCGKIAKHSATILSDVLKHLYITQFYM